MRIQQNMEIIDITKITMRYLLNMNYLISQQLTPTTGQRARIVK